MSKWHVRGLDPSTPHGWGPDADRQWALRSGSLALRLIWWTSTSAAILWLPSPCCGNEYTWLMAHEGRPEGLYCKTCIGAYPAVLGNSAAQNWTPLWNTDTLLNADQFDLVADWCLLEADNILQAHLLAHELKPMLQTVLESARVPS